MGGYQVKHLKIAYVPGVQDYFTTNRELVEVSNTDFTDVSAVVLTSENTKEAQAVLDSKFDIPLFVFLVNGTPIDESLVGKICNVMDTEHFDLQLYSRRIDAAATQYEENVLPPFFKALSEYVNSGNAAFDCPGHQGGQYFRKHPAGRYMYDFYGENLFRSDICNADLIFVMPMLNLAICLFMKVVLVKPKFMRPKYLMRTKHISC